VIPVIIEQGRFRLFSRPPRVCFGAPVDLRAELKTLIGGERLDGEALRQLTALLSARLDALEAGLASADRAVL